MDFYPKEIQEGYLEETNAWIIKVKFREEGHSKWFSNNLLKLGDYDLTIEFQGSISPFGTRTFIISPSFNSDIPNLSSRVW